LTGKTLCVAGIDQVGGEHGTRGDPTDPALAQCPLKKNFPIWRIGSYLQLMV
jgi:hypothetical protein